MAMNPSKLKALVDTQAVAPGMAALSNPSVDTNEPDGDEAYDDEDDGSEEVEAAGDPLARGNDLIGQWGELGEALKDSSGELVDQAHEIGGNLLLAKVPEDAIDEVQKAFDSMPEELQHCLAKYVSACTPEDCTALAAALIDGHDGDTKDADQKLLATYLTQLGTYAKEEVDPDDIPEEEEDEDEEGDGEGADDADIADGVGTAGPEYPGKAGSPLG